MIRRRFPLKRSTRPIPKRRSKPRRAPSGIDPFEWRNEAYRAFLKAECKCVACLATIRNPAIAPEVRLDQLRPGIVAGFCDPAHTENNGMRSKGRDSSCAPLCRWHHRQYDSGRVAFEAKYGVDMQREAAAHWLAFQIRGEGI